MSSLLPFLTLFSLFATATAERAAGDDSTIILINFGRSKHQIASSVSTKIGEYFVGKPNTRKGAYNHNDLTNAIPQSYGYMHDSGKPYGYNAGTNHPQYGWSGGLQLNENTYFDNHGSLDDTDWRYECAVRFPKTKKFEVEIAAGKYQVEVTYGSRDSESSSEIKIEGTNPEVRGIKSLITLTKNKFTTRTYYDVEVKDGKMTFQLTKAGQAKTRIMYMKITQGYTMHGELWDGSQIDGWKRKPRNTESKF